MPGISQCMIVKNEEQNIERALSWGKDIVSEQIVVDTGSIDNTVKLAMDMGAKVYEFPWIDDFSAAKNYAISKAKYEWIAFLDADEYISQEDAQKLLSILKNLDNQFYDGIITAFVNLDNMGKVIEIGSHLRIFRNVSELRYHRKIHEHLKKAKNKTIQVIDMSKELCIYHTGYGKTENQWKKSTRRNLDMILKELEECPDDYEMYGYLGNEYARMEELTKAEEAYRKAILLMPEKNKGVYSVTSSEIFQRLLRVLTLMPGKGAAELQKVYIKAKEYWPENGDYDYVIGQYYASHGNYLAGEKHLRQAISLLEMYGYTSKSALLSGNILKAYEMLAICCFNNGNLEECVKTTAMMLKRDPYLMSALVVMLSALFKDPGIGGIGREGAMETIALLGNNFYQIQSLKDRLFVLQAALKANYGELVGLIKETFSPDEFEAVDQALGGKLSRPAS